MREKALCAPEIVYEQFKRHVINHNRAIASLSGCYSTVQCSFFAAFTQYSCYRLECITNHVVTTVCDMQTTVGIFDVYHGYVCM